MAQIKIKEITRKQFTGNVYNLEVEPNHPTKDDQYYIHADNGLVVHNCHPRDNIALSYLAESLDLRYDLFKSIMHAREQQARKLAIMLSRFNQHVVILGRNYKHGTDLEDGSYSLLVGHYLSAVEYDTTEQTIPVTYLLSHSDIYNNYDFNYGSVIVDPWRTFITDRDDLTIVYYGKK